MKTKAVSIIIPNTDSFMIRRILDSLIPQAAELPSVEILVVGTDGPGLVVEDEFVRFIPTDQRANAAVKRNLGMREARGEILGFLDDDCLPAPDWLDRHLYRHRQGELVVGGSVTFGTDDYLQLADNVSAFHDLMPFTLEGPRPYLATANLSVNRVVVDEAGGMRIDLDRAEDLEWTVRIRSCGHTLYFDPQASVFHEPNRYRLIAVWRQWTHDAPYTLAVRLLYTRMLRTPDLARHRSLLLWGAPLIAAWATARTFAQAETLRRYWHTIPMVYFTKLAWCYGAFMDFPHNSAEGLA